MAPVVQVGLGMDFVYAEPYGARLDCYTEVLARSTQIAGPSNGYGPVTLGCSGTFRWATGQK